MTFKFIDLFSGIGGFRIAMESIGGVCVMSSDIDLKAREAYRLNFGEEPMGDITKISSNDIPNHNILCGGFPCQPFSIAGLRKGFLDTRGTLFFDIERIIREKKPDVIFLENVRGLVNHDKGKTLDTILSILGSNINGQESLNIPSKNLGYKIYYKVLNSRNFGVPQNRERIYIVGFKDHRVEFNFPEYKGELNNLSKYLTPDVDLNIYGISAIARKNIESHLKNKSKEFDLKKPLLAYEIRPSKCSFRNDDLSPCLTAKMGTGGNNVPVLVQEMRKLTVKECLLIQGFPDNFFLEENKSSSYKMVGNSVSLPVIKLIAKEIKKSLSKLV